MELKEYYENPAISQSKLKLLLNNPKLFNTIEESEMYFEEKEHFIIGSAVDCLLTQSTTFADKFYISNLQNKPSDTIKSIINQVFDIVSKETFINSISDYPSLILKACDQHAYQSRWNNQTRIDKICEYFEYWEDLKKAIGKQVLSQEEYDLISRIVMSIKTNENTSKYFQKERLLEIFYQYEIYFIYEGIECKALLDMVIIDHINKTIQPIDIKTMGDYTINFPKSLRQRRYDLQASWYTEALKSKEIYTTYKILPFKFIVESTIEPGIPLVFTCTEDLLFTGKYGIPKHDLIGLSTINDKDKRFLHRQNTIKGFHQLIEDYKWYLENNFEKRRDIVEQQGEFSLDWNGII